MNTQDRIKKLQLYLSNLKKIRDEIHTDELLDINKITGKKYTFDNAGNVFHVMLESIKKNSLEFGSQIEIIYNISPFVTSHLSELLDEFEEERLRVNEMFGDGFMEKIKTFDHMALAELDKAEENMEYLLSIGDNLNEMLLAVYSSINDTVNFMEK